MNENEIAKKILDAAFVVHTKLGPGLLEWFTKSFSRTSYGKLAFPSSVRNRCP